ncbi:MAG: hypothetical protein AAF617_16210 [Bacteroidota bacterium]
MIQKLQQFEIQNASQILGGDHSEETNASRRKSADKMHNKITQLMMS